MDDRENTATDSEPPEDATTVILGSGEPNAAGKDAGTASLPDDLDIDWGGHEDEIRQARDSRMEASEDSSLHRASTKPIPNAEDRTTRMDKDPSPLTAPEDVKGFTTPLEDALEKPALDKNPDDDADAKHGAAKEPAGSKQRGAAPRPPRSKTPLIVGFAILMIALAAAFGIPALQDYLDSQRDATYSMAYIDSQTGEAVAEPIEQTQKNRTEADVKAPEIDGYQFSSGSIEKAGEEHALDSDSATITLDADNPQTITFTYTKFVGYKVRHLNRDGEAELGEEKYEAGLLSGAEVTEQAPAIDGYDLDSDAETTITLINDEDQNVITFYYKKTPEPEPVYVAPAYNYTYTYTPAVSSGGSSGGGSSGSGRSSGGNSSGGKSSGGGSTKEVADIDW